MSLCRYWTVQYSQREWTKFETDPWKIKWEMIEATVSKKQKNQLIYNDKKDTQVLSTYRPITEQQTSDVVHKISKLH
jgi:hypothetical protein